MASEGWAPRYGAPSWKAIIMATRLVRTLSVAALFTASLAAPAVAGVINGTNGPDVLVGTANADTIHGYAGDDTLSGRGGADKLYGGGGGDRMYAGRDVRRDLLYGGPGPDRISARMFDRVYAGRGNDVIRYVGTRGYVNRLRVDCGPGYDIVYGGWQARLRSCEDRRPHSFALYRYHRRMPDSWKAPVVIPYGEGEDQLGTSLGGDGEGIWWGPDYGTVAPDGTWWILDGAKLRFAHYDASGTYLGAVGIPPRYLVEGRYMQWQHPLALADGTIVTYRLSGTGGGALLLLREGSFEEVALSREVTIHADDGAALYGFGPRNALLAVDVTSGTVTRVDAFRTRTGVRFRLMREGTALRFALPDVGVTRRWPLVAADTGARAAGAISLTSTADGRLHVFVDGAAANDESTGRSGYGIVDPGGRLHATGPTRVPWSTSDGGTGSRLVARPGSDEVWFIAIDTDAVRLYRRR